MTATQGERVADVEAVWNGDPGAYAPVFEEGEVTALWFKLPTGTLGRIAATGHGNGGEPEWTITAEDDGTVSVEPSIAQQAIPGSDPPTPAWHGYLRRGVWT